MSDSVDAAIEIGLAAWRRGDLEALQGVLDPRVKPKAVEPGLWDCANRDEVKALLRLREIRRAPGQDRQVRVTRRDDARRSWCPGWAAATGRRRWSRSRTAA